MESLTESQKILINELFNIIAHDDELLVSLATQMGIQTYELENLVNDVTF